MLSICFNVSNLDMVLKKAENAWKYWASKATVMYTVSTLAAIVMVTALRLINGFEPV